MKTIQLTQGKETILDDIDYELVSLFKWQAHKDGKTFYASSSITVNGVKYHIHLHKLILVVPEDMRVDHRNRNGLDNRRQNLRPCTHAQNLLNRPANKNTSSKHKNVHWRKDISRWQVSITISQGKRKYLGCYKNEATAAQAYNDAVIKYHGEFIYLNEI